MSSNTTTKGLTWNQHDTITVAMKTTDRWRPPLDDMLVVWAREIPNLDPLTEGIVERIQFLAKKFDQSMDRTLNEFGLDHRTFPPARQVARLWAAISTHAQSAGRGPAPVRAGPSPIAWTRPNRPVSSDGCPIRATGAAL